MVINNGIVGDLTTILVIDSTTVGGHTTSNVIFNTVTDPEQGVAADHPTLSADGNLLAYAATPQDVQYAQFHESYDVYLQNLSTGVSTLVS